MLNPLAKFVSIPLGLESGVSAVGEGIHKKSQLRKNNIDNFNKETEGIMIIIKSLEEFGLLIRGVNEIQNSVFLSILVGT